MRSTQGTSQGTHKVHILLYFQQSRKEVLRQLSRKCREPCSSHVNLEVATVNTTAGQAGQLRCDVSRANTKMSEFFIFQNSRRQTGL